jgi:hypothetical protein
MISHHDGRNRIGGVATDILASEWAHRAAQQALTAIALNPPP